MGWNFSKIVSGSTQEGTAKYYKEGSFDSSEKDSIETSDLADGTIVQTSDDGWVYFYNEKQDKLVPQFSFQE